MISKASSDRSECDHSSSRAPDPRASVDDNPAVEFVNVSKWYGEYQVLYDVDLTVSEGERLVICGASGSGKSTLVRCVNQLERHQSGEIRVRGILADGRSMSDSKIRRETGMVFQQFNLYPHLTVLENCALAPMWVKKLPREQAEELAKRYLARVHVSDQASKYPAQLSGGQQQRVAIARCLCMEPKLLLFDEPTSALDPEMVHEVLDTMIDVARSGASMICVTHEMGFAREVADRIVFMDGGKIIEQGPPSLFFSAPQQARTKTFLAQILR